MKYITTSLLSSFRYWKESEKPIDEFMDTLNKVRTPPNESMQRGINFENDIQQYCHRHHVDFFCDVYLASDKEFDEKPKDESDIIIDISDIVKGGLWQEAVKKTIEVNGQQFMLYGKADVIKQDTIYDIKTTAQYELGKYNTSSQHLIYMYCTGIKKFEYLIAQGGEKLENFYIESYTMKSDCEVKLKEVISEFLSFLDNCNEAKIAYEKNWVFNKCLK